MVALAVLVAGCAMKFKDETKAIKSEQVNCATAEGDIRVLRLSDGGVLRSRTVVVATGAEWRRLEVPAVEALQGRGASPELAERLKRDGIDPAGGTAEEFGALIAKESAQWRELAKSVNIKLD